MKWFISFNSKAPPNSNDYLFVNENLIYRLWHDVCSKGMFCFKCSQNSVSIN